MKKVGFLFLMLSFLGTFYLFILAKNSPNILMEKPYLSTSQISALWGMVLFCYSFFLGSRFSFLEILFGGLDKVYKTHQVVGRLSFIFIISHFVFLILNYVSSSTMLSLLIIPGNILAYNLGIFSLWSMSIILAMMLYLTIDYQWFVRIQKLFIVPFSLGVFHMFLISSDSSRYLPLTIFLGFHAVIAFVSWIYRTFLYGVFGPHFEYVVCSLKNFPNDIIEICLQPLAGKMPFLPGQFAYTKFYSMGVSKEFHPFSMASSPVDNNLRFSIKAVGDFTTQMKTIKVGDKAVICGPYGTFFEGVYSKKDVVCVAGGIGITPFLSMVNYFREMEKLNNKKIYIFYSVKNYMEAIYKDELTNISQSSSEIVFKCIQTELEGRLNAGKIQEVVGELRDKIFCLCGPPVMMQDLEKQFKFMNVSAKNIIFEDFNYR